MNLKSQILIDFLSPTPEKKLYHYTTQAGLLGIIRSKEIWLSHTQYLNDTREYRHAVEILRSAIQHRLDESRTGEADHILRDMLGDLDDHHQSINVCVASFSRVSDSLSQWRAYGGPRSAFAVGFDGDYLASLLPKHKFFLVRCVYDPADQHRIMEALVTEVYDQIVEGRQTGNPHLRKSGNVSAYLHKFAPILKDPAFAEEHEWRIISRPLMNSSKQFTFREGASALVPYYRLALSDEDVGFQIAEVVVGPTPNAELLVASVNNFLVSQDLRDVPVSTSRVPFRNW